ncbi:MAG TPA: hypothetical protein VFZ38_10765 [Vicinamibacterales bacterium]
MGTPFLQPSFSGGELSPSLFARVDLARYGTSLRTCENFIVLPEGGIENRAGLRFIKATKDSTKVSILVPFEFSTDISYIIELGDLYARFYFDGAPVMSGMTHVEIATPWGQADLPFVRYTQSADVLYLVHPDYPPQELRRTSATSFQITDYEYENGPFRTVNTDDGITVYASAETGAVTLTASSPIFLAGHIGGLFKIEEQHLEPIKQWEASKLLANEGENPLGVLRRSDGKVYRCTTDEVAPDQFGIHTGSIRPIHTEGVLSDGDGNSIKDVANRAGVDWEYLHSQFGIVRIDSVGGGGLTAGATVVSRLPITVVGGATSSGTYSFTGNGANTRFFMVGASSARDDDYRVQVDVAFIGSAGFDIGASYTGYNVSFTMTIAPALNDPIRVEVAGDVYFRALGDGTTTVFTFDGGPSAVPGDYEVYVAGVLTAPSILTPSSPDAGRPLDLYNAPMSGDAVTVNELSANNTSSIWSFGAWSLQYGYPAEVEFYADRLIFAATYADPQSNWFTKVGDYVDFNVSSPVVDDDAITATLNARQINAVRDIVPLASLILMTSGGEWRTATGQNDVLTPSTVGFKPQSYNGIEQLPALIIDTSAIYASRGYKVRSLGYQFERDGYSGDELSIFSSHLLKRHQIVSWDYQQVPYSAVWAVRDDGVMLTMTYQPDQQVVGWSRHITDGIFESVSVVSEGGVDAVYAIVRRVVNGSSVRYVERIDDRDFDYARDCFFVDSGLTFDGRNQAGTVTLTGSGFTVNDNVTVTASGSVFSAGDVGDWVVLDYGLATQVRLRVIAYTSGTVVTVRPLVNVPVNKQATPVSGWAFARDTISGLAHLEGRTVKILADGNVQADKVVTAGAIALDTPGTVVQVGLGYTATATTLDLNAPGAQSIRMVRKLIRRVGLLVEQARNIWCGPSPDRLEEFEPRFTEALTDNPEFLSGLVEIHTSGEWDTNGRVTVQQDMPLPIRLLGLIPDAEGGE